MNISFHPAIKVADAVRLVSQMGLRLKVKPQDEKERIRNSIAADAERGIKTTWVIEGNRRG